MKKILELEITQIQIGSYSLPQRPRREVFIEFFDFDGKRLFFVKATGMSFTSAAPETCAVFYIPQDDPTTMKDSVLADIKHIQSEIHEQLPDYEIDDCLMLDAIVEIALHSEEIYQ